MTASAPAPVSDSPVPPSPAPAAPLPAAGITALGANRAALTVLLVQAGGAPLLMSYLGLELVPAFLISLTLNLALLLTVFRHEFAALRRDPRWTTRPNVGLALAVFVVAFMASRAWAAGYLALFPDSAVPDTVPQLTSGTAGGALILLTAGVLVPVMEELAFRGLMLRGHERAAGFMTAALTTTLAFSLAHGVPMQVMGILPLAYVLARLTQHTGSLWNAVIVHVLNNSLALALALALGDKLLEMGGSGGALDAGALGGGMEGLTPLVGAGAFAFGSLLLLVLHLWLTPRTDPQERAVPGPWFSGAYALILLLGLAGAALTFPSVVEWLQSLRR